MLDMLHLISDKEVQICFQRIYEKLSAEGTLLVRATIPSDKRNPWKRWIETTRLKITDMPNRFRGEKEIVDFMKAAGFDVSVSASATKGNRGKSGLKAKNKCKGMRKVCGNSGDYILNNSTS